MKGYIHLCVRLKKESAHRTNVCEHVIPTKSIHYIDSMRAHACTIKNSVGFSGYALIFPSICTKQNEIDEICVVLCLLCINPDAGARQAALHPHVCYGHMCWLSAHHADPHLHAKQKHFC